MDAAGRKRTQADETTNETGLTSAMPSLRTVFDTSVGDGPSALIWAAGPRPGGT